MLQILTYVRVCFVWTPVRHNIIPGMVVIGRTQVCKGEGESRGNLAKKREVKIMKSRAEYLVKKRQVKIMKSRAKRSRKSISDEQWDVPGRYCP